MISVTATPPSPRAPSSAWPCRASRIRSPSTWSRTAWPRIPNSAIATFPSIKCRCGTSCHRSSARAASAPSSTRRCSVYRAYLPEIYGRMIAHLLATGQNKTEIGASRRATEDARYVLPLAQSTQIGMTANARMWGHVITRLLLPPPHRGPAAGRAHQSHLAARRALPLSRQVSACAVLSGRPGGLGGPGPPAAGSGPRAPHVARAMAVAC